MNSNFLDKSLLPPPESFYRRECGELTRPDRHGYAKTNCPFHQSKSKKSLSVNVREGNFYCHGCGTKGGDLIAFLMKRDGMTFRRACELLGCWRQINNPDEARRIEREKLEHEAKRQRELERIAEQKRQRLAVRDHLHTLESLQRECAKTLDELEKKEPGIDSEQKDLCWASLATLGNQIRDVEQEYSNLCGLEATR